MRRSGVASAFLDDITVLRFYAQHWDARYERLDAPPQARYAPRVADLAWCAQVRAAAAAHGRPWSERWKQWQDFMRFGFRSGPKFVRFWYQRLATEPPR